MARALLMNEYAAGALPEVRVLELIVDEDVAFLRVVALAAITVRICVPGKCSAAQRIFYGAAQCRAAGRSG